MQDINIIKVPGINGLNHTRGCEKAPDKILENLKNIYSNEKGKEIKIDNLNIEEMLLNEENINEINEKILSFSINLFNKNYFSRNIFLGGDHSISHPLVSSFFQKVKNEKKEPCLIIFDAHPDLMFPTDNDSPNHEEWLRKVIEEGFPKENILLVGTRNCDKKETDFIKENKIKTINMDQFVVDIEETCDFIMEFSKGKELYVSLDIDVVDPSFAPGTYYKEPGGFTSREIIYLIKRIQKIINLKAIDIVEFNPDLDKDNLTVNLVSKLLSELI